MIFSVHVVLTKHYEFVITLMRAKCLSHLILLFRLNNICQTANYEALHSVFRPSSLLSSSSVQTFSFAL
jgi:hypothetical protein